MSKSHSYDPTSAFDDSGMPTNPMTAKREAEIDAVAGTFLKEALKRLSKEKDMLQKVKPKAHHH